MDKNRQKIEAHLLTIIHHFLLESGAERAARAVAIDALLERDLGIGSLEKAELFHRIEKAFSIRLPDRLMIDAKNVQDLMTAIMAAKPQENLIHYEAHVVLAAKQTDPSLASTLVTVLQLYAQNEPNRPHIYLQKETGEEEIIYYGQLYEMAKKVGQGLIHQGLKPGETVAIMLPTSGDFFYAFYGILLAGGIPVPIYPPFRADQIEAYAKREALILRNAGVRFLITFQSAEALSKLLKTFIPSLLAVTKVETLLTENPSLSDLMIEPTDPALIQYTSGSTGNPKGVLLTHANLLANIRAYGEAIQIKSTDVSVSWLPLYHDMGLIGSWLGSLYYGVPLTLMSPLAFLARPERWLWAIHYRRATLSAGPNFAYELCIKKIDDADIEGLDLSSWRIAFNGAEMIYPKTIENFVKRFSRYGFGKKVFLPVYGLAENSLALAFPPLFREPRIDYIQRDIFEKEHRAIPAISQAGHTQAFIACGQAVKDHEIRIVDENRNIVGERIVGSIQFRGPSAMQGYYQNPEASQEIYHDGWWNSGDLGYMADGEIFITGRKKDLIIKAGRNYYPAEIEEVVNQISGIRKGCVAIFGVDDVEKGTEKLIVVAETTVVDEKILMKKRGEIIDAINEHIGIPPDRVILVPPQTIPKTSSGKLRRSSCKQDYLSGKLGKPPRSVKIQIFKLFLKSQWKKIKDYLSKTIQIIFNIYSTTVAFITLLPIWGLIIIFPRKTAAKIFRFWCRLILTLWFCPLTVKGQSHLSKQSVMVYIANHASYMDALIMAAILPAGCCFVGKKELSRVPVIGSFIRKLEYLTVDRLDFSKSQSDTQKIEKIIESGRSIVIFPEGTFTYATGIRLFKAGAFKIAIDMDKYICPIAIRGARKMLRANSILLRPVALEVTICEPLKPIAKDWNEIVRLRETSRKLIAKYCGENTIDLIISGIASQ